MNTKEKIAYQVSTKIPEPYYSYVRERNGNVSVGLARIIGIPYLGLITDDPAKNNLYHVLARTITRQPRTLNEQDFYGLGVESQIHVGKAMLHPNYSHSAPSFYSAEFARYVTENELVLPGYTAFTKESAVDAYDDFAHKYQYNVRIKLTNESDGNGQIAVNDRTEASRALRGFSDDEFVNNGVVIEHNLNEPVTISAGLVYVDGQTYCFLARQKDDKAPEDGRNRYRGASVMLVRGNFKDLSDRTRDSVEQVAVKKVHAFYKAYSYFDPSASRISFDVLFGLNDRGSMLSGVTDITGRVGGTDPILIEIIKRLNRDLTFGTGEVNLNYEPQELQPYEENAALYINQPSLRISARVNKIL